MRAMQSTTAYMEMSEFLEFRGAREGGSYAALQMVSRRFGLKVIEEAGEPETVVDGPRIAAGDGSYVVPMGIGKAIAENAGLVHDVGNLLGALSLYADLLSSPGVLHDDYREYATDLRLLSKRSSEMVSRLVERTAADVTRDAEAGVVIPDVLRSMGGLLDRLAARSVQLSFEGGSEWRLSVSREAVERIAANLVKNAGEAMDRDAGTISIKVCGSDGPKGRRVMMRVADSGRGMTRAQLGALGAESRRERGRGIGFRVVQELVAQSDGVLSIASALGGGTIVEVEWCVADQPAAIAHTVTRGEAGWIGC